MKVDTLIVGAGPAGLAAARGARSVGRKALVIDENWNGGGQIWRGQGRLVVGVAFEFERQVVDLRGLEYDRLILACGARELFLPFPGWTLPHVVGAGGLQALVKNGLDVRGKRIVIAGSGPLLLAVAANLTKAGAEVLLVAEQTSWTKLARFAAGLWRWPSKMAQGILLGNPRYRAGLWPVRADAGGVTMSDGRRWDCDYLACGFGLVPNLEVPRLAGCAVVDGFVEVDEWQRTSVDGVYAVGEITGIGGVEKAEAEGWAAGCGTKIQGDHARFVSRLAESFELRTGLRGLATPDTIVCRCEDVKLCKIVGFHDRRDAKLQTRCGMGACQGRICGPILEFLYGWEAERARPPILPTKVSDFVRKTRVTLD